MTVTDDLSMRVQTLPGLREQVAERLRMAIATGRFPAGTRLIERELCEMMGVSRTSLREALRELQADDEGEHRQILHCQPPHLVAGGGAGRSESLTCISR